MGFNSTMLNQLGRFPKDLSTEILEILNASDVTMNAQDIFSLSKTALTSRDITLKMVKLKGARLVEIVEMKARDGFREVAHYKITDAGKKALNTDTVPEDDEEIPDEPVSTEHISASVISSTKFRKSAAELVPISESGNSGYKPGQQDDVQKCRLCLVQLSEDEEDDLELEICCSCKTRPEARQLGIIVPEKNKSAAPPTKFKSARDFTPAEKDLISKVHGFMLPQQLLKICNERLFCDLGPDAMPYTMEQLHAEIGDAASMATNGDRDFASLRQLLSKARKDGVLQQITEQVINDFAVVYSLNQRQVLVLKDILLQGKETNNET